MLNMRLIDNCKTASTLTSTYAEAKRDRDIANNKVTMLRTYFITNYNIEIDYIIDQKGIELTKGREFAIDVTNVLENIGSSIIRHIISKTLSNELTDRFTITVESSTVSLISGDLYNQTMDIIISSLLELGIITKSIGWKPLGNLLQVNLHIITEEV